MKPLSFLRPAEQEMTEAARFYESQAEGLGAAFLDRVELVLASIQQRPAAGHIVRPGIRRRLLPHFPYAILYREEPDAILVLAVMHLRRRPGYWADRL